MGDSNFTGSAYVFYSLDNNTWNPVTVGMTTASIDSTNCISRGTISVASGSIVYVSTRTSGSNNAIQYNAQTGSTCPSNSGPYCETAIPFSASINAATDIAVTVYLTSGLFVSCV